MSERLQPVFGTTGPGHHFFGYYDKSPLEKVGNRLLCLKTNFADRLPRPDDVVEIGCWDVRSGAYQTLAETRAFNWQQGCMLQWLGPDFNRRVIYNDRDGDRFVSVILDLEAGTRRVIPFPVYTVHPDGTTALAVDFERHYFPRAGYAYAGIERPEKSGNLVPDDGIFRVDLTGGSVERIIATGQMYETRHLSSMEAGPHYLEHLMYSPSGRRFQFLHRWVLEDGGIYTRLYTANPDGTGVRLLLDSGKATHACWRGDGQVLVWGARETPVNRLRRRRELVKWLVRPLLPLYHRLVDARSSVARGILSSGFLLIDDVPRPTLVPLGPGVLTQDGHPGFRPGRSDWLLADTYPDADGYQALYLYSVSDGRRVDLGRFFHPPAFRDSPMRCDLHPRWDFSGGCVCIDSMHGDGRQMYVFDVSTLINGPPALDRP